jgi:hypothetical protein
VPNGYVYYRMRKVIVTSLVFIRKKAQGSHLRRADAPVLMQISRPGSPE